VTDAFSRRIVGWNVSPQLMTESLPLQALEMASWGATHDLTGLVHHANHGSQHLPRRYSERLADLGIWASTGSVGDIYYNTLAESINGLSKTELIKPRKPCRTIEEIELATLEWVWWFNNTRLHSEIGYRTPNKSENAYYNAQRSRTPVRVLVHR